jgi:hypothetical protein
LRVEPRQGVTIAAREAELEDDGAAFDIAEVAKPRPAAF